VERAARDSDEARRPRRDAHGDGAEPGPERHAVAVDRRRHGDVQMLAVLAGDPSRVDDGA